MKVGLNSYQNQKKIKLHSAPRIALRTEIRNNPSKFPSQSKAARKKWNILRKKMKRVGPVIRVGFFGKQIEHQGFMSQLVKYKRRKGIKRSFKCPYEGCKKSFPDSGNLKTHIRIHVRL